MPGPSFTLKCLGYPELHGPDGRTIRIRVKKHLGLLVYLAVERRQGHDRARLAELLWPSASPSRARHSCATAISYLRGILGHGAFSTARNLLRFHPPNLQLDLDKLQAGEVVGPDGEALVEVDGFLRGFDLDDSPEWSIWKEQEHARWLPAIHAGLLTLIDQGRRRGSHEEIHRRAERLLALDSLAEEGIRARMEAFSLVGDRVSALRAYDEWTARLARELGAEPSMVVEGMASQLRKRGWEPKEPNPAPAVLAEQWHNRAFVGRKVEYRQLYETWEAVRHYRPRHLLISGDSGVGKTTLAQRLVTAAGLEGASVSRVQCYAMEQRIPFATIGGLVAGLLGRPGVAATAPEALAEIARIVPQVKGHFPHLPSPKPSEGESARLLFAEGVVDLLRAIMDERPVLLVVDDIHLADEASLAVFHFALRRIDRGKFMALLTVRPEHSAPAGEFAVREATTFPSLEVVALGPMPEGEAMELVESLLSSRPNKPAPPEKRALLRAAKGYPMVLELVVQDWHASGRDCVALALRALTADLPPPTAVEAHIARLFERLLDGLSQVARQALAVAAVLGPRLNDLPYYGMLDLNLAQTLDGLSQLAARRVLRDAGHGLEFINELVRAHAYRSVPAPLRVRLHGNVANRLLESEDGANQSAVGLEAAWHLIRAKREREAAPHLIAGARAALLEGAPDDVVLALTSCLRILDDTTRAEAVLLLVQGLQESARWASSLEIIDDEQATPRLRVLQIEALWRADRLTDEEQLRAVDELIGLASKDRSVEARSLAVAAFIAGRRRDEDLVEVVLSALPATLNTASASYDGAILQMARANLEFYRRRLEPGEIAAKHARAAFAAIGAADASVVRLEIGLSAFRIARGDYSTAYGHLETAMSLAKRIDNEDLYNLASANAAIACLRLGRLEHAIKHARAVGENADAPALEPAIYAACCALGLLGRHDEAVVHLARSQPLAERFIEPWVAQMWSLHQADIYWMLGRRAKALELAHDATANGSGSPRSRGIFGMFTRWTNLLVPGRTPALRLEGRLAPIAAEWRHLDALDQVEVLTVLEKRCPRLVTEEMQQQTRLAQSALPDATTAFLSLFAA